MNETPSPERLQKLPAWAQEYVAWLRSRVSELEQDRRENVLAILALFDALAIRAPETFAMARIFAANELDRLRKIAARKEP